MNAATEVKRHKLTQEDCDIARFFTRRGMKIKEIAKILKVDPSTVGKIQKADFRLETYLEQRKEMNRKTKENKQAAIRRMEELEDREQTMAGVKPMSRWPKLSEIFPSVAEESTPEVPGQMKMDLEQKPAEEPEKNDDNKQMKFQAAMMDKLLKKLDELIEVLRGGAEA